MSSKSSAARVAAWGTPDEAIQGVADFVRTRWFHGLGETRGDIALPSMFAYLQEPGVMGGVSAHGVRCFTWNSRCVFVFGLRGKPYEGVPGVYHLGAIRLVHYDVPFHRASAPPHWDMCTVDSASPVCMRDRLATVVCAALRGRAAYDRAVLTRCVNWLLGEARQRVPAAPSVYNGVRMSRTVRVSGSLVARDPDCPANDGPVLVPRHVPDAVLAAMAYELAAAHGVLAGPGSCCNDYHHVTIAVSSGTCFLFNVRLDCTAPPCAVHCILLDVHPCAECASCLSAQVCGDALDARADPVALACESAAPPLVRGGHRIVVPVDAARADDTTAGIVATYLQVLVQAAAAAGRGSSVKKE